MNEHNLDKNIKYLRVIADMKPNSMIMPLKVIYDNKEYVISEIFDIKKIVVEKVGELCLAYYCKFNKKIKIIFLDKQYNWFSI